MRNMPVTVKEFRTFSAQNSRAEDKWPLKFSSPCLHDRSDAGGVASGHYFHQDLLVTRRIYERSPKRHVDVGSRVDGFVAHIAVFREIEVLDIRPMAASVQNIKFRQADLMNPPEELTEYCDSLSCLHALEHFGLGRYGDPIDAEGYRKGFAALSKMLAQGGILYLSLPIGRERVEFNGQRVFSIRRVAELYEADFELVAFSYVDDRGDLFENADVTEDGMNNDLGLEYGCGIFELKKR